MTKRVGLYARVSDRQQEENTSLYNQIEKARDFALAQGFQVVAEQKEIITGASRWGARTKFNTLLEMGDQGKIDAIIVDVKDRLGRGRALATLADRAEKHGLEILFADGSILDPVSLGVSIIVSGREREEIGRRSREGKLRTAERGGVVSSLPPFGYTVVRTYDPQTGKKISSTIELVPDEIETVVKMYHWLIYERETLRKIERRLYAERILPRCTRQRLVKDFGEILPWDDIPDGYSKAWARSSVRRILQNEIYTGRWYYNRRITKRKEVGDRMRQIITGERDKSEWICIDVPGVISDELFEQVQEIMRKNLKQQNGRRPNRQALLRGLVYCSCGRRMQANFHNKKQWADYRCNKRALPGETRKDHPRLDLRKIDPLVWNCISELLLNPSELIAGFEQRQQEESAKCAILREQAELLNADIHKAGMKLDRLLDVYTEGDIDRATYQRKRKGINDAIKDAESELNTVQSQLEKAAFTGDDKAQLLEFCQRAQQGIENADFEQKRQMLLILDVKVMNRPETGELVITGAFPDKEVSVTKVSIPSERCASLPPPLLAPA